MTTTDKDERDIRNSDAPEREHVASGEREHTDRDGSGDDRTGDEEVDDPQFQAVLSYIEKAAEKFISDMREAKARNAPPESSRTESVDPELDESAEAEALPGTDEYDKHNGIPYYDVR